MNKAEIKRVCVFSGSSDGGRAVYAEQARALGRALTARGWGLVYGGGSIGLMGAIADAVAAGGGAVIGVIPRPLATKERVNDRLGDLRIVRSMHERKALMVELSDAFVALPGGFGTCDELFEVITWAQLGIHQKPIGLLNVNGYFNPLIALIEQAVAEGFVLPKYRGLIVVATEADELLARLVAYDPLPGLVKWAELGET